MLIIYRKAALFSFVSIASLVLSYLVDAEEWTFALRLLCVFSAFLVGSRYNPDKKYLSDIKVQLERKMGRTIEYVHALEDKRDWKFMIYIPSLLISLASGFILCPSFNFGTEFGLADVLCELICLVAFGLLLNESLIAKNYRTIIEEEADNLYWDLQKTKGKK